MIDVFFRVPCADGFQRTVVTTAPDAERAHALIDALCRYDAPEAAPTAGGRPSRRRGSVSQLVARRDQALDRELVAKGLLPTARVLRPRFITVSGDINAT